MEKHHRMSNDKKLSRILPFSKNSLKMKNLNPSKVGDNALSVIYRTEKGCKWIVDGRRTQEDDRFYLSKQEFKLHNNFYPVFSDTFALYGIEIGIIKLEYKGEATPDSVITILRFIASLISLNKIDINKITHIVHKQIYRGPHNFDMRPWDGPKSQEFEVTTNVVTAYRLSALQKNIITQEIEDLETNL